MTHASQRRIGQGEQGEACGLKILQVSALPIDVRAANLLDTSEFLPGLYRVELAVGEPLMPGGIHLGWCSWTDFVS